MAVSISHLLAAPRLILSLKARSRRQHRFLEQTIFGELTRWIESNDGTLSERDFKKIRTYYGNAVTSILGEAFCTLRGRSMSPEERQQLTYMGAFTGLFDDLFDHGEATDAHILEMVNDPDPMRARNDRERLFVLLYQKALGGHNTEAVQHRLREVFEAQVLSRKQRNPDLDQEQIWNITRQKGGASLLFYRSAFSQPLIKAEEDMLFTLGGLGQLENDIFDVYKDHLEGINTLMTTTSDVRSVRDRYLSEYRSVMTLLKATDFSAGNKKQFGHLVKLIAARGLVCLDHLAEAQRQSHGEFLIKEYAREQLICDMEERSNQRKLLRYFVAKFLS